MQMDYPAAAHRLQLGVPATVEHASEGKPHAAVHAQLVAETTQSFITLMDALKLKMRAKDQLHPLLSDLLSAYTKVGAADGEAREKLLAWCVVFCLTQAHYPQQAQCERRGGRDGGARDAL